MTKGVIVSGGNGSDGDIGDNGGGDAVEYTDKSNSSGKEFALAPGSSWQRNQGGRV